MLFLPGRFPRLQAGVASTYSQRLKADALTDSCLVSGAVQPPLPYVYQSLFRHKVKIVDEQGEAWTVQYEGFVSAAQRHYRFTAGWTNLVKQKGIKVGKSSAHCGTRKQAFVPVLLCIRHTSPRGYTSVWCSGQPFVLKHCNCN